MKNWKKVISSALLAAMLVSTVAGCGNKPAESQDNSAQTSGSQTSDSSENAEAESVPAVNYDEKLTIVIGANFDPVNDEFGKLTDPVTQMLNEKFNIEIEAIDGGDSSDWPTRLSALIAANDIPDIVAYPNATTFDMMYNAKQLLELSPYINETITPNLVSDNKYLASELIEKHIRNGEVYRIGMCRGTWDSGNGATVGDFIRWDLYKELGYPEINNYDDLLNVLKEMQEKFPTNADGKKCYAVGAWFGDGMGWADWPFTFARDFAGTTAYISDPYIAFEKSTGAIVETNQLKDVTSPYWQMMEFYNKAYRMGILDPESFTQKYDAYEDKNKEGRYYYLNPGWLPSGYNQYYRDDLGNADMGFAMIAGLNQKNQTLQNQLVSGERNFAVSAKTKNPERVMALLDYLSTYEFSRIALNGMEGVYWEIDDAGNATVKPEFYDGSVDSEEIQANSGAGVYGHVMGYGNGTIEPETGLPVDLRFLPEVVNNNLSNVEKDQLEHFGATSLNEMFTSQLDFTSNYTAYSLPSLPTDLQTAHASLADYKFKNTFKIIMAETEEEFAAMRDTFMAEVDQFNVDAIFEYYYNAAKEQEAVVKEAIEMYNK